MNRTWITGLTLASVAGSGGAFAAAATSGNDMPVAAQSPTVVNASDFVQAPTSRTINYQVGAAGTVTLTVTDGMLNVDNTTFGTGWTGAATMVAGSHVEVQFTDTAQLVTFGADLVNNEPVVALTNVPAPGVVAAAAPTPMDVTVIKPAKTASSTTAPQPRPATQPIAAQPTAAPTAVQSPRPAATTAPSGSGDDDSSDDRGDDEHEESNND
jgi:hypothetical protein